jgi:hypothetical protein
MWFFHFCAYLYRYAIVRGTFGKPKPMQMLISVVIFQILSCYFPQSLFQLIKHLSLQLSTFGETIRYICTETKTKNKNMKTKSLFFAALVMLTSAVAFAGKDEPRRTGMAVVPVKGSETFKVIYKSESTGKVKLNIYNVSGKLILTESFSGTNGFIIPVNFSGLQPGEYTIELIDATGKKSEKITLLAKEVKSMGNVHVSRLTAETGKFLLSVANTTPGARINVRIYDAQHNLIHSESKSVKGDYAQVYKVNTVSPSYTFEVSDSTGTTKTIRF